jgi:NTP pyrophosphatase (non-canonical NTP hydrolase)
MGEVGELAELLQWLPADEIEALAREPRLQGRLGEELADVLLYLVRLSDVLGIDLALAAGTKLQANQERFVAAEHQGRAPIRH